MPGTVKSPSSVEKIKIVAEKMFAAAKGSHDWEHTLRVFRLCRQIGNAEGADMDVLLIAACLHDIGRCYQDASHGRICHAEKGAELAETLDQDRFFCGDKQQSAVEAGFL